MTRILVYSTEGDSGAVAKVAALRADRYHASLRNGELWEGPKDVERCDRVIVFPSLKAEQITADYGAKGIPVEVEDENKESNSQGEQADEGKRAEAKGRKEDGRKAVLAKGGR